MKSFLTIFTVFLMSANTLAQAPVKLKSGMIKVSVTYPNVAGESFDMDYYTEKHLPMVAKLLGSALKGVTAEKGLCGAAPGSPAPYIAVGNMYFNSVEEFNKAFGPNAEKIMSDLPNFTGIKPVIQISEILL